jgi:hypothetical protein
MCFHTILSFFFGCHCVFQSLFFFVVDLFLDSLEPEYMLKNPHTLLVKYLGLHSIELYRINKFFVVMENIFMHESHKTIAERFKLKGSWVRPLFVKKIMIYPTDLFFVFVRV